MLYTAQYNYKGEDRLDISVKGNHPFGKLFAPTWEMVNGYLKGTLSTTEYTRQYYDLLIARWNTYGDTMMKLVEDIKHRDVTVVCFCAKNSFCHRYLLVRFLQHNFNVDYRGERHEMHPVEINSFSGKYRFLSNFWEEPGMLEFDGLIYNSTETAFQAAKVINPQLRLPFTKMTPGQSKRAGRKLVLRLDWEEVKVEIMYQLLKKKFSRDKLKSQLLATGNAKLVEGNTWGDTFWGVCGGQGKNMLGQLLMRIRYELR